VRTLEGVGAAHRLAARRRRHRSPSANTPGADAGRGQGHKTGFYLDQRDNRARFCDWVRHFGLQRVLNCYCYTGGFSVAALAGGADHVTSVDSSAPALERAQAHVALNGFDAARHQVLDADVNQLLRDRLKAGESFDAIVLDPPKFAPTASHAERAARAYKDINRLALKLLRPGGLLLTFSCSAASAPSCSTRSWPARRWMPASTAPSCSAWKARPTTRRRWCSPKASTSRAWRS
jgi:16S rRNA G966 N2-methylase RsmD